MHSEKIKELDPPTPTYVEDPTLEPGVESLRKRQLRAADGRQS
mgnify:CR=1 FL=1